MKIDSVFTIPCTCNNCEEEGNYYICKGCLRECPYCFGCSDYLYEYCDDCWYEITYNLTTVIIKK